MPASVEKIRIFSGGLPPEQTTATKGENPLKPLKK